MFKPLSLFVALRYTRAKRQNHFISFIALSSMLGIALGVMVLITVLSVMNGFDEEIKSRVFAMAPQVEVGQYGGHLTNWQTLRTQLRNTPQVVAVSPQVTKEVMLSFQGLVQGAMLMGIDPVQEAQVSVLAEKMVAGKLSDLSQTRFGIVLGVDLADQLGVGIGSHVTVVAPTASLTPAGILPRFKRFTVVGLFQVGRGFGYDARFAYIHLPEAQTLFQLGNAVTDLRIKLSDLYFAPKFSQALSQQLPAKYLISDWTMQYGSFFRAISLEKTMMFLILMLIIAVAAFNLVSSLVMVVTDKQNDIAILRTFGASPGFVLRVFMLQGFIIASVGIVLGVVAGIALSSQVSALSQWLQQSLHMQLLSSDVYYVDYLPSRLRASDVFHIIVVAFIMSLIATLYPAWRATRIQPAQVLRYV